MLVTSMTAENTNESKFALFKW